MFGKRMLLFAVAALCFVVCFFTLNLKYDRFYRVAGLNNENRQLLTRYLDEDEQDYLVETALPFDSFARFLTVEGFSLYDLEYYEAVEKTGRFADSSAVVDYTNRLLDKIRARGQEDTLLSRLLDAKLGDAYLEEPAFAENRLDFYAAYSAKAAVVSGDIDILNQLDDKMRQFGYDENQRLQFLSTYGGQYRLAALEEYFNLKEHHPDLQLVGHPDSLTAVVNATRIAPGYEPEPLTIPYDVPRTIFACYLRQDAALGLEKMARDASSDEETLLLVSGYRSFDVQTADYIQDPQRPLPGTSEFGLGLTAELMVLDVAYDDFQYTGVYEFLKENSWKYGFVERGGEHFFRYVGPDAAKLMHEKGLSLEAYEGLSDES